MPAQTKAPTQTQAADHEAVARQTEALEAQATARRAELLQELAAIEHDQQRAARALAELSREREDHARARQAAEAREARQAQAAQAQAQAVAATDRYRTALTALEAQVEPLAALIAEALEAEDALARVENQRHVEGGPMPLLRHTRTRLVDAIRVAGHLGGLDRRGEFAGHPATLSFGQAPLSAAFSALPAGLGDPAQAPPPQALSAHALASVDVAMPGLSPDPVWRGSPFDQPQPASTQPPNADALPPLVPFDPTRT